MLYGLSCYTALSKVLVQINIKDLFEIVFSLAMLENFCLKVLAIFSHEICWMLWSSYLV